MVGKICERGTFLRRKWKSKWIVDGKGGELTECEDALGAATRKSEKERLGWDWRRELGSWFQRHIDDVGGRATSVTRNEERVLRCGFTEMRLCRWMSSGCQDFVGKWEEFVLDAFAFLANLNSRSRSLYAIARPSVVCLSSVWLSSVCLSSVTKRPCARLRRFKFSAIFLRHFTLAIHWHPLKFSRRSSQGNPSDGGVKHKRGSKI